MEFSIYIILGLCAIVIGQVHAQSVYAGCGTNKTCLGYPDGCVDTTSCVHFTSFHAINTELQYEIVSFLENAAWVGSALSLDTVMGDDAVTECVTENGTIRAFASVTTPRPAFGADRALAPQDSIQLVEASNANGVLYCKINKNAVSTFNGVTFDVFNVAYHVMLAGGARLNPNGVAYHSGRIVTLNPLNLTEIFHSVDTAQKALLIRWHGALMVTAWVLTASLGMVVARYFKKAWHGKQLAGKDVWFPWHVLCMSLTWLMHMSAFIIIFVHVGGWAESDNPHAILGIMATIFCLIQPIGGFLRPAPDDVNRKFFNWAHLSGGTIAHLFAVLTMAYAASLPAAELDSTFSGFLYTFVAAHLLFHVICTVLDVLRLRRSGNFIDGEDSYTAYQKYVLYVYVVIVLICWIAMIVLTTQ